MTAALTNLQAAWDEWHAEREEGLRAPHGWLSLTSRIWLGPEPADVAGLPGRWSATPEGVVVTAAASDGLSVRTLHGQHPVDGTAVLHPVDGKPGTLLEHADLRIEVARRTDAHVLRVRDPHAVTRTAFTGVPAFPAEERWVVEGRFRPYPQPRRITVGAVVDGLSHFPTAVGEVELTVAGVPQRLVALAGKDGDPGLTLHFRDATSGVSTYGGGRILRTGAPEADGRVVVDLNRTVNLPCAFTDFATCPLPPEGNRLTVAVEAGEQLPRRPDHA